MPAVDALTSTLSRSTLRLGGRDPILGAIRLLVGLNRRAHSHGIDEIVDGEESTAASHARSRRLGPADEPLRVQRHASGRVESGGRVSWTLSFRNRRDLE